LQRLDALGEGRVSQIGFPHSEGFLFMDYEGSHFLGLLGCGLGYTEERNFGTLFSQLRMMRM
jgi:hypothetical protein